MSITLHIKDKDSILDTAKIKPNGKKILHVKGQSGVNYELINDETDFAPENLVLLRQDNDLFIAFEGTRIQQPDMVIENYYEQKGNNLIVGKHENGNYYPYVPESNQSNDTMTQLSEGRPAGQALGGTSFFTHSDITAFNPYWLLLPLAAAGIGYAIHRHSDDDDNDKSNSAHPRGIDNTNNNIHHAVIQDYSDKTTSLSDNDDNFTATHFNSGKLITEKGNDIVTINNSFGKQNEDAYILLGSGDDEINLGYFYNNGDGSRDINGGQGIDILTIRESNQSEFNDLLTSNIEVINVASNNNELNISLDMLLSDDISTVYINNTGRNNVIDLGDNNIEKNSVDLGGFSQSQTQITTNDATGDLHTYDVYINNDATETLYIDSTFTVL